ncbi:PAS domain S-box protein [Amphiplicatus metriothermophilus]|uniref:histidine kinase n=1 Tax=Amphiplicatus metriothermophilus TaxID=1519374 RepID=A0A239PV27_9PROT|nr:PAS domain S-box protein [Amphiplicatus metriothermophilus]MBB5519551.1 PAS domain S-box-containing protein [Amphiplicatus metriothermophilus]SNT74115.1 PAS domain S-box-containing protein [Amphiplicatus metriothermophilus]
MGDDDFMAAPDADVLERLIELIPEPAWIYDASSLRFLAVNTAALARYGYAREQFLAMTIKDIRPAEDRDRLVRFLAKPRPSYFPAGRWRHLAADGRVLQVEVVSTDVRFGGVDARLVLSRDVTERESLLDHLELQKSLFTIAENIARMGSWEYDIRADRLVWSEGALRIFGVSPDAFEGGIKALFKRVHPEDRDRLRAAQAAADAREAPLDVSYRILRPDGSIRLVYERGEVRFDEAGAPIRRVGVVTDVTRQAAAEDRIRQSETLLRIAEETAHIGGWRIDLATSIVEWSDEVCRIHDMPPGSRVTVEQGIAFYAPEYRGRIRQLFDACARKGEPYDEELQIVTGKGRRVWVRSIGRAVRDAQGRITHVQGAFQDITGQKEAERTLEASRLRFRRLAESMPQIVWTADPDGAVDYANAAFYRYIGSSPEEFDLSRWIDVVHPEDQARCREAWAEAVGTGEFYAIEFRIRRADGAYRWHSVTATPVREFGDAVTKWFGAAVDDHDRWAAEERARRYAERLEATLESISDGFYALDEDWRFTFINSAAEAIIQRSREDLIGRRLWDEFPDLSGSEVAARFKRARRRKKPERFVFNYEEWDAWFDISAYPSAEGLAVYFRDVTKERAAEAQMRLLEASIARTNDLVLITEAEPLDEPGPRIVFVNDAFARRTGYAPEEVIGASPRFLQGPGTQRKELDRLRAALVARQPFRGELINYTKSGEEIWLELDIAPVAGANGEVTHFVAVERDITERVRASAALRQSEARFRAVANATADVIWDWNLKDGAVWWSEGFETRFGHPVTDEPSPVESWTDHLHPEDKDRVLAKIHDAIERRRVFWQDTYRYLDAKSEVRIVEDRGYLILDDDGEPARFVGGMSDVTERERAREALHENAERLARQISILQDLTRSTAENGDDILERIVASVIALLGCDGAALATMREQSLVYAAAAGSAAASSGRVSWIAESLAGKALETGRTLVSDDAESDARVDRDAARAIGARSVIAAVLPGADRPAGVLEAYACKPGAFAEADAQALTLFAQSAGAVLQRHELEERMRRSQRLEAIGQLTGGIAHDFNNLLTVILGNAETLAVELADDEARRPLAELTRTAAERGAELTNRLLAFARKQPLDPAPVDLNRLVADMDALLRRTLGEHIEIEVVRGAGLWPALVDAAQLESAVLNLCLNARDAMPDGGRLTIELANTYLSQDYADTEEDVKPGQYVMLAVSDTGVGMSANVRARAFEPFFTTKDPNKGSGLGLSMVFGFVKQSNGHVKIYSEEGQGATIKIYLPRAYALDGEAAAGRAGSSASGGDERILLVEDDDLVRGHILSQLRTLGYKVIEARNAREALEIVRQVSDIDLLLTDIVMPGGMNGRELAREIGKLRPEIKALYTSGYTENAIVHHGRLDAGVNFISKPFRREELARKVRMALASGARAGDPGEK